MENSNVGGCPNSCFRPVGLDFDQKGRLFVSSDTSGEIYATMYLWCLVGGLGWCWVGWLMRGDRVQQQVRFFSSCYC